MKILVVGGAGYIGSHVVRALKNEGLEPIILDSLIRGHKFVAKALNVPIVVGNVGDQPLLKSIISGNHPECNGKRIDAVMHFAAFAYVGESVSDPSLYYNNNLGETLNLLEVIIQENASRTEIPIPIVFSSTCATYGIPSSTHIPISENCPQKPINPYGHSKLMVEQIIIDYGYAYSLPSVIFRYFNAAGADPEGSIGEIHEPETHLIPLIFQAMTGNLDVLDIYGSDYPTPDGTCIRDYIHVNDLAYAHVLGLRKVLNSSGQYIYNLGNGGGYSVKEVIETAKKVTKHELKLRIASRRLGDPPVLIASAQKAFQELGWKPCYPEIETIIRHAWSWHQSNLNSVS